MLEVGGSLDFEALLASAAARPAAAQGAAAHLADFSQVPLTAPAFTGGGSSAAAIDYPDLLKAKTGFFWSVRRLTLQGWSAGSVTVTIDGMEPVAPYPSPAVFTFGRGELLLHPDSRLVVQCTGITGTVQLWGAADCFPGWMLKRYMGIEGPRG